MEPGLEFWLKYIYIYISIVSSNQWLVLPKKELFEDDEMVRYVVLISSHSKTQCQLQFLLTTDSQNQFQCDFVHFCYL